ncbi:hypothetical protein SprV_0501966900 [Sparganum proliferum]
MAHPSGFYGGHMLTSSAACPTGRRRGRKPGLNSSLVQRNAANARERSRMRVLSSAFVELKGVLPWVPKDTKLSKLDTLKLAAGYIAYLKQVLDAPPSATKRAGCNSNDEEESLLGSFLRDSIVKASRPSWPESHKASAASSELNVLAAEPDFHKHKAKSQDCCYHPAEFADLPTDYRGSDISTALAMTQSFFPLTETKGCYPTATTFRGELPAPGRPWEYYYNQFVYQSGLNTSSSSLGEPHEGCWSEGLRGDATTDLTTAALSSDVPAELPFLMNDTLARNSAASSQQLLHFRNPQQKL